MTDNVKADMTQVLGDRDMGIHTQRAMAKARTRGAAASAPANFILWSLSKRELVEIALYLAAALTGNYETSLDDGSAKTRVIDELNALRSNGLL